MNEDVKLGSGIPMEPMIVRQNTGRNYNSEIMETTLDSKLKRC